MSIDLSDDCREVLRVIKELQIDGRPISCADGHYAFFRRARFDRVPECILRAEFASLTNDVVNVEAWWQTLSHPDHLEASLVELRTRGLINRARLTSMRCPRYERPDGLIVEISESRREGELRGFEIYLFDGESTRTFVTSIPWLPDIPTDWGYGLGPGWEAILQSHSEWEASLQEIKEFLRSDFDGRTKGKLKIPARLCLQAIEEYPLAVALAGSDVSSYLRGTLIPKFPMFEGCIYTHNRKLEFHRDRFIQACEKRAAQL